MIIGNWLTKSAFKLRANNIKSARLDAELLLAHVLKCERTWLAAHAEYELKKTKLESVDELLARRLKREPIAYILGKKEFYGRDFTTTPDVLIPRPETENLIESVLEITKKLNANNSQKEKSSQSLKLLDIGTGSGAIAITLALELPNVQVFASDISEEALSVAAQNATDLGAKIEFAKSNLLQNICNKKFDIITANLPYVAREWKTSPETSHEPEIALFAGKNGLELIEKLIKQAPNSLKSNGFLVLELDPCQIETTKEIASEFGFSTVEEKPFTLVLQSCRVKQTAKEK